MKRTLLFIGCVLASWTMLAQEQLAVEDLQNSGCLWKTRGEEYAEPVPTIVLTKENSILSVQVLNYESNCATVGFNVKNSISEGTNGIPMLTINITPNSGGLDVDCMCPYNVSFTLRDLETNTFYLKCWWYEGLVTLEDGEPLVLEDITLYATIDGLNYTLKKTLGTAMLTKVVEQKSKMLIPAEINYEGQTYTVKSVYHAFGNCTTIKTLDIPESITTILVYSFVGCKLDTLIIRGILDSHYLNNDFFSNMGTDTKVFVQPSEVEKYKAIYNGPVYPLTEVQDDSDYIPFVQEGKTWNVFRSDYDTDYHLERYSFPMNEKVVDPETGKTYFMMYQKEDDSAPVFLGGFREENRKVYFIGPDAMNDTKEYLLFDYSLKAGDTYEAYSPEYKKMVKYEVRSVGDYSEGPEVISYDYDENEDRMISRRRYLRKWVVQSDVEKVLCLESKIWIEGVGSPEGPLANLYDASHSLDHLAYVIDNGDASYLPFSFRELIGKLWFGCNLPTGEGYEHSEDKHHHLTYELEGNRLHVYGKVLTRGGVNNYAYFIGEPTDNCSVLKLHFEIQEIEPLPDPRPDSNGLSLRSTDFYVEGVPPTFDYIVVDNQGEEHPVINKTQQVAYRPFIEEGKVWKVGGMYTGNPVLLVKHFYFEGDTIIDGRTCKKMMSQLYINPDIVYVADPNFHSAWSEVLYSAWGPLKPEGAWYEEDKKVYRYDPYGKQFELMYDFSVNAYGPLSINDISYEVGPRQTGVLTGFKGVFREVWMCLDGVPMYRSAPWLEGVGGIYGPTVNVIDGQLDDEPAWFLMSCTVGDEVIYLNEEYEDGASPDVMGARKRIDFTHTIKTKPKMPRKEPVTGQGEGNLLYAEYNDLQLDINLNPLDDAYQVCITDDKGKTVYEKNVNAASIVGLNIDISTYAEGRYTVTVENGQESFTGVFETVTTGISDTERLNDNGERTDDIIYNLQGQRILSPQKGLNILNGQKVYVK